jgi:alkylation response protein AidB-like acyl-CoA dehydrogenase
MTPLLFEPQKPVGNDWLDRTELAELTPQIIRERLIALQPLIRDSAAEAERLRQPVTAVIEAIRKTGLFYLMIPKAYGGLGAPPEALIDVITPIAECCLSTAWVCAFVVNHNWLMSHMPQQAQDESWGGNSPYVFAPAVSNPPGRASRVDGGYKLSGHWKWGTCVAHADWLIAFAFFETAGDPAYGMALLPIEQATVYDTWRSDGLCGTASHDVVIEDLFVPEHRISFLGPVLLGESGAAERFDDPAYAMPMLPFLSFAASAPVVGGARAAIEAVRRRLAVHTRVGDAVAQAEKPLSQARLARGDLLVRSGEALLRMVARELPAYVTIAEEERTLTRLRWRAQVAEGVHMCRQAAELVSASAGSSMHFLDNPLQRILRDLSVLSTHFVFDLDAAHEQYGRKLVGLEPNSAFS